MTKHHPTRFVNTFLLAIAAILCCLTVEAISNAQTESEPERTAVLLHHYSLEKKYYEANGTNIAGYVLEGDAKPLYSHGATSVTLLPPKQLATGSLSTYYSATGIKGWELSVEFIWHHPDTSAIESYDESDNAPRSGLNIWWTDKPFEREADITLENSIALGGSKAFDGMTISFDAPPMKSGTSNLVNIVGRLSYLPSGNRYRVGECSHALRTGRRTRVDIKFVDRTLKVIVGKEEEDGKWTYDFCIHSAPVDLDQNERFVSISARNAYRGSRESITLLSSEFRSLDTTWSPTLHVPEYRKHMASEILHHIDSPIVKTFATGSVLTETKGYGSPDNTAKTNTVQDTSDSSILGLEKKVVDLTTLVSSQNIQLHAIHQTLRSIETVMKAHGEDESNRAHTITKLIESWGVAHDAKINNIEQQLFPKSNQAAQETVGDFDHRPEFVAEEQGSRFWLWAVVVVVALGAVFAGLRPKKAARYSSSKDFF